MNNSLYEISDDDELKIYAKMVIALFKSFLKESIITEKEYESLSKDVCRTFNL